MRYHIDTIPVWDAMKLNGECLMCALERKTELGEAERYLGASVMEPDVRVKVNDKGFCRKHHAMLFMRSRMPLSRRQSSECPLTEPRCTVHISPAPCAAR